MPTKICNTLQIGSFNLNTQCTSCMPETVQPKWYIGRLKDTVFSSGKIWRPSTGRVAVDMPLFCKKSILRPGAPFPQITLSNPRIASIKVVGANPNNTIFYQLPSSFSTTFNVTGPWKQCNNGAQYTYVADPANTLGNQTNNSRWVIESDEKSGAPLQFNPGVVNVEITDSIGGTTKYEVLEVSDYDNTYDTDGTINTVGVSNKLVLDATSQGVVITLSAYLNYQTGVDNNGVLNTSPGVADTWTDKGTYYETPIHLRHDPVYVGSSGNIPLFNGLGTKITNIAVNQTLSTYPNKSLFSTVFDQLTNTWKLRMNKLSGGLPPNMTGTQGILFDITVRAVQPKSTGSYAIISYTNVGYAEVQQNIQGATIITSC